jgi:glucokinase
VRLVVGLDLGGSTLRSAVMSATGDGAVDEKAQSFDTLAGDPIERIAAFAREHVASSGGAWSDVDIVGIGLAGSILDGGVSMATNIAGLEGVDIVRSLSEALDRPVVADNDANIAALSEWVAADPATKNLALIAVGTGVGVGVVSDGRLLRGQHGEAGEVGFLPMAGEPGLTIEHLAGGAAVARAYNEAVGGQWTGRDVLDLGDLGDDAARAISERQVGAIAWLAVAVRYLIDPEVIVLGGGIGLRPGFADAVAREARRLAGDSSIDIRQSTLSEQSVAIGAAHFARLALPQSTTTAPLHSLHPELPAGTTESSK